MSKFSKEEIDELEQKFEAEINEIYNSSNKSEGVSDSDKAEIMEVAKGFNHLITEALTSDTFCKETNERLQTQKAESVSDELSLVVGDPENPKEYLFEEKINLLQKIGSHIRDLVEGGETYGISCVIEMEISGRPRKPDWWYNGWKLRDQVEAFEKTLKENYYNAHDRFNRPYLDPFKSHVCSSANVRYEGGGSSEWNVTAVVHFSEGDLPENKRKNK